MYVLYCTYIRICMYKPFENTLRLANYRQEPSRTGRRTRIRPVAFAYIVCRVRDRAKFPGDPRRPRKSFDPRNPISPSLPDDVLTNGREW